MKAIFFDVDDTLYDQVDTFQRAYDTVFGERFELDIKELYKARGRRSDEVFEASQKGIITMEEMYIYRGQKAFEDIGIEITAEEALALQEAYARNQADLAMPEPTRRLLDDLKKQDVVLGVITNGPSAHQWKKVNVLKLQNWIKKENLIISGDVGINKPDRGIFEEAKSRISTEIEELWFVGDNYANDIQGAKNAGWKALWLNRWRKKLQQEDVQPDVMAYDDLEMSEKIRAIL